MRVQDGQRDFSGGMVDRVAPERLAQNQYAYGKNLEVRNGGIRSRRGSWLLMPNARDGAGDVCEVTGAEIFRYPIAGVQDDLIQAIYRPDVDETRLYVAKMLSIGLRTQLTLPTTLAGKVPIRFVQAYDALYALRGGDAAWRWGGDINTAVEAVPDGVSGPMPLAREGVFAFNRLWLIEGDDTVIPSDLLDANWNRTDNEFRVEQGDGTRLVALQPFAGGNLVALKERGLALIRGANNFGDSGDLALEFISESVGCVAADSVVSIGSDILFLGFDGVWSIQQTSEQNAQLVKVPLSEAIYGLIQEINWQHAVNSSAVVFDNYYLLAVPVGGSVSPNRLLVFDLLAKCWVGFWEYAESEAEDDDGLHKHFALRTVRKSLRDELLSIGRYGNCGMLCKGCYKDWTTSEEPYIFSAGGDIVPFSDPVNTVYGGSMATHLSGTISCVIREDGGLIDGLISFNPVYIEFTQPTSADPVTITVRGVGAAGVTQWEGTVATTLLSDGGWHTVSLTQLNYGGGPFLQIDGVTHAIAMTVTTNKNAWVGSVGIPGYPSFIGLIVPETGHISRLTIEAHPNCYSTLTDFAKVEMLFDEGTGLTSSVNRIRYDGSSSTYTATLVASADWGNDNDGAEDANIESILKTRGFDFGEILAQKSNMRGEIRFAHGQPSVTMEMASDAPFDTETLINAKTFSLTAYEVRGRAAWSPDNANDDFHTPHREDYAPVPMGVLLGDNGITLDKHREHTEFFSSLANFGWAQFTLTNTQGFIRYNALALLAQARIMQQDTGNNGN